MFDDGVLTDIMNIVHHLRPKKLDQCPSPAEREDRQLTLVGLLARASFCHA
jgi:hypothetical protein